jgi:nucleoside-diphosphate-sugar epimerase
MLFSVAMRLAKTDYNGRDVHMLAKITNRTLSWYVRELINRMTLGEPYNIASREKTTVNQLAEIFIEMAENKRPEVTYAPARVGDRDSFMSTEKARTELGFEAKVDLSQGLAEFVQWVRSIS